MEAEEITKLVDGVYRNILDRFNPGARQLIAAGKSYLKALHGAATASRLFNEALAKIAMNAQQSGTGDIGSALMSVVNVNKEIQEQQMNILKAFYVDLLVPLETNLEKDTKVVQHEQKKFLQQHKVRMESYQKAVSTMKKQRKKKATPENTEKELRSLQLLEDQKKKLDVFCDQSYKNAMTQERRRYGFVLERQCSIAKHWMAYHTTGKTVIDNNFENWQEIAASREIIPPAAYESGYSNNNNSSGSSSNNNNNNNNSRRLERIKDVDDDHQGQNHGAQLKKSRSIDAPYGDMRTLHERENMAGILGGSSGGSAHYAQNSLPRAKSDFNLALIGTGPMSGNKHKIIEEQLTQLSDDRDRDHERGDQRPLVKALYAYMPSGENQLSFEEGDRIALVGGKAKGWQFGENLRTQHFGWFPVAYTNAESGGELVPIGGLTMSGAGRRYENMHMSYERNGASSSGLRSYHDQQQQQQHNQYISEENETATYRRRRNHSTEESSSPTRMFGDTIKQQKKYRGISSGGGNPRPGPPPTLPAPVPNGGQQQQSQTSRMLNSSQSFCATNGVPAAVERRKQKLLNGVQSSMSHPSGKSGVAAKTSLHSSNDSGFANEPPPQPEVDYSDEEPATQRVPIRRRADTNSHTHTVPRDVASWTLNRNFGNSVDSQIDDKSLHRLSRQSGAGIGGAGKMRYDLIASDDEILQASSAGLKRTKSFWKFGGGRSGEDILAGMSLWQHRDLVAAPNLDELRDRDMELERRSNEERNGTLTKSHNSNSSQEKRERSIVRKDSLTSTEPYGDDDENIYGISQAPQQQQQQQQQQQHSQQQQQQQQSPQRSSYTPKSRMKIMKTIEIDIEEPREEQREQQSKSHTLSRSKPQFPPHSTDEGESDEQGTLKLSDVNNFFDDNLIAKTNGGSGGGAGGGGHGGGHGHGHGLVMKTVKRQDILKQYYTSEDDESDAELKSTSSDPYDCIVINDHLVRKDDKLRARHHHQQQQQQHQQHQQMEFHTFRSSTSTTATNTLKKSLSKEQDSSTLTRNSNVNSSAPTATILPRTRLLKSSSSSSNNHNNSNNNNNSHHKSTTLERNSKLHTGNKSYGPWYDFWDQEQQQHGMTGQKSSSAKLK
ncbi:probable serine/threonine-protein kinase yakA [Drosophila willistoni]|uniref:probable serine/threonine-protein kinase yakA n=1 Tax=Drosophila willistoni TaxID=7260 RepID=UPI001F07554A|nr:probable serine/threonine-protein kinase yakA [Drosophila willistoni]XP_023033369.2 probable serine/threonine-protein kinase yakA [Drosophila willistoni]